MTDGKYKSRLRTNLAFVMIRYLSFIISQSSLVIAEDLALPHTPMKTAILVPVKDPARAKARMAAILTAEERSLLAQTMFEDLVAALCALSPERPVVLVTTSQAASERA